MIIRTEDQARRMLELIAAAPAAGFDTEFSGPLIPHKKGQKKGVIVDPVRCELTGFSIDVEDDSCYVPLAHQEGGNCDGGLARRLMLAALERQTVWIHGLRADALAIGRWDSKMLQLLLDRLDRGDGVRDGAAASWLLDSGRVGGHGLKRVRQTLLGLPQRPGFEDVFGKAGQVRDFPAEKGAHYAELDAQDERELGERLWQDLSPQQRKTLDELEMPLLGELIRMARLGVPCDPSYLERLRATIKPRREAIESEFLWRTGAQITSRQQFGDWAFDGRWPNTLKRVTKDGHAKVDDEIVALALAQCPQGSDGHWAALLKKEHALGQKMEGTYCDGLLRHLAGAEDSRLHPSLGCIGADGSSPRTGRFSCSAPNLQNLPKPHEDEDTEARIIRSAFRPEAGWEITEADQVQIELRILGHLCGGVGLYAEAARNNIDMHTAVGKRFNKPRHEGKHLNFAVVFRCGSKTLSARSGRSEAECRVILKEMRAGMPEVEAYYARAGEAGNNRGGIRTLSGRFRSVPELKSAEQAVVWRGERIAGNTPVQGGARDVIAAGIVRSGRAIRRLGLRGRQVMTVHDSVVYEHPAEERAAFHALAHEALEGAWPGLRVPLAVDIESGPSWGETTK